MMAGWAMTVAVHGAWGFETPDDVVQATLLALVQNFRDGRFHGGNLRAYVQRIAKNMCITHYRRVRARGEHVSLEDTTHAPASRLSGEDMERRVMLNRILDRLGENCRRIVLMAYIQGYSRKEIGERMGISEQAARVKLFRCIRNARDMMDDISGAETESV
jgi:RNA polymerase sigma-70 factor (ECF subfamily)